MSLPTRWIACVDGTWCSPDGAHAAMIGNRHDNISNIYRICASIKEGECVDELSDLRFDQQKRYYEGLGSEKNISWLKRLETGAFGSGFSDQIRQVYKDCCLLSDHPQNEIWLFGFSRGAYVVRAVASLLHHIRALTSAGTPEFDKHFEHAIQAYRSMKGSSKPEEVGRIHHHLAAHTRKAPRIQFVGVLDTVKALKDGSLYDIGFNDSIQHLRHALALNEDRRNFEPEYYFPDYKILPLARRSIVQAWFIGAHLDIGGSAAKDGLALYPLQWLLTESRAKGLELEFDGSFGNRANIDDPLKLIFPSNESEGKGADITIFTTKNKLQIYMQDLRQVHKLPRYQTRHAIHLNRSKNSWMRRESRVAFGEGAKLKGYCEYEITQMLMLKNKAAQGTILHPSVYLIFDEYSTVFLDSKALPFRNEIEEVRDTMLTTDGFWNEREIIDTEDGGAIRILVCGNTGVGKSTLINEVFGAELTKASDNLRGIHNIKTPIVCQDRPDLIIHDSGGFESGGDQEFQQVKDFIHEMSNERELNDRLHVIWLCIEMNSPRIQQKAAVDFFTIISQNAEIPVVVVLTKKDEYWDLQFGKARKKFQNQDGQEAYADEELRKRLIAIEEILSDIKDARYDAVVAVSKEDKESIDTLAEETARCFDHEKVRRLYVAAQVRRIDLKVDLAVTKAMQIYKRALRSAGTISFIPLASTTNRVTVAVVVCKAVVNAFGVPSVTAATIQQIVKNVIWDDMGHNFSVFIAECVATAGIIGTLVLWGMPVFLATSVINAPVIMTATAELVLMLACDLILILRRAFKDCTHQCLGQPLKKDIEKAAMAYRPFAKQVHQEIKKLTSLLKINTFRPAKIKIGLEQLLQKYAMTFIEQSGVGTSRHSSTSALGSEQSYESSVTDLEKAQKDLLIT
ncbi:MAG: hypothetical protein Q9181_007246 [Wetmoreana brouardii]